MDRDYLAARNVRICLQGHQPFQPAVRAIHDTIKVMREGGVPVVRDQRGSLIHQATRRDRYEQWAREYLGSTQSPTGAVRAMQVPTPGGFSILQ